AMFAALRATASERDPPPLATVPDEDTDIESDSEPAPVAANGVPSQTRQDTSNDAAIARAMADTDSDVEPPGSTTDGCNDRDLYGSDAPLAAADCRTVERSRSRTEAPPRPRQRQQQNRSQSVVRPPPAHSARRATAPLSDRVKSPSVSHSNVQTSLPVGSHSLSCSSARLP